MSNVKGKAQTLAQLHESGEVVILPTVWDTWSARIAADAGFAGLTIGSHPVADAIGSSDGENMDFAEYLAVIARIVDSVDVPVSADVESGYGLDPAELTERVQQVPTLKTSSTAKVKGYASARSMQTTFQPCAAQLMTPVFLLSSTVEPMLSSLAPTYSPIRLPRQWSG